MAREITVNVHAQLSDKTAETQVKIQDYGSNGKYLDIRKTYEQGGERLPSRKGISMHPDDVGGVLEALCSAEGRAALDKYMEVDVEEILRECGFQPMPKAKASGNGKAPAKKRTRKTAAKATA